MERVDFEGVRCSRTTRWRRATEVVSGMSGRVSRAFWTFACAMKSGQVVVTDEQKEQSRRTQSPARARF